MRVRVPSSRWAPPGRTGVAPQRMLSHGCISVRICMYVCVCVCVCVCACVCMLCLCKRYPHVTFFFNGGVETVYPDEDRLLIDSPRDIATYDERPEMSA